MKQRAFTLVEFIVVVAIIGILAAILWPIFQRSPCGGNARVASCQSNLKQIGLGLSQYVQDYDETFPPVAVARAGDWAGSLQSYVKSWSIFQCPSDATTKPKTTDYFYNARLPGLQHSQLTRLNATIILGEGQGDQLPLSHLSQLPAQWADDAKSPARRHCGVYANYAFADGHVKRLKPEQITLDPPAQGHPTFGVQ